MGKLRNPMETKQEVKFMPSRGIDISIPKDKKITQIQMESVKGGISLAIVGSASAPAQTQKISLKPSAGGITLALVGSASATRGN